MSKTENDDIYKYCYFCGEIATTREHAPPKCFFPMSSETPSNQSLRRNLITVPSCEKHNLSKSNDDEYLLAVIATHHENNPLARKVFRRVLRAIKKRPWIGNTFYSDLFPIKIGNFESGAFKLDIDRFNESAESIARAIYFHHFNEIAPNNVDIYTYSLINTSRPQGIIINTILQNWRKVSSTALEDSERFGENPEIFYYQTYAVSQNNQLGIRLVFYEGVVIDAFFEIVK